MASSATVGAAVIKLSFDGKNVNSQLAKVSKTIEESGGSTGSKFGTAWLIAAGNLLQKGVSKVMSGVTSGMKAVVNITKTAVEGFSEFEQLVGGVDTLFKDASKEVQQYADMAYKTAQISANEYMSTVTSFSASLLQSLGGDTQKAAKYADQAIIDMADNANKMGTSMDSIQNAYQGFAKQNYTMLDNLKLGYGGTRGEMQRLLKDAEAISGIHFEMDNFADMTQAIHIIQTELGITGTSAEEASKTIQGSLNSMKSAWQNLVVGMADPSADFDQLIGNLVGAAGTFLENLIPAIEQVLPRIGELIDKLVPIILEKLPGLIQTLLPLFINVVTKIAIAIIQNFPMILTMVLNGFLSALPGIISAIVEALPQIITAIIEFLTNPETIGLLVAGAVELFFGLVLAVPQILGALIGAFGTLVGNLWNGITSMFGQFAANFGEFISGIFRNAINGMISFIENFINTPINLINGFLDIINGAFGWLGVNIGHIDLVRLPRLAQGGYADGATTAVIGEAGKEAVLPLENNTDNWAGLLAHTLVEQMEIDGIGGGTGVTIQKQEFVINNEMDANDIGRVMMQSIRRAA